MSKKRDTPFIIQPLITILSYAAGGGRKTPPRVVKNPTQGLSPPRAFGKSHPGFWKITNFARTVQLYFLVSKFQKKN